MEQRRSILKDSLILISGLLLSWLIVSFVVMETDPREWTWVNRWLALLLTAGYIVLMLQGEVKTESQQEEDDEQVPFIEVHPGIKFNEIGEVVIQHKCKSRQVTAFVQDDVGRHLRATHMLAMTDEDLLVQVQGWREDAEYTVTIIG